jgi:hypothetical protein
MSTRSRIAIETPNGALYSIYCHSDGYSEHVGTTLATHWTSEADVRALIDTGALSILGDVMGEKHDLNEVYDMTREVRQAFMARHWCSFFTRDRDEDMPAITHNHRADLISDAYESDAEYVYIFTGTRWQVFDMRCPNGWHWIDAAGEMMPAHDESDSACAARLAELEAQAKAEDNRRNELAHAARNHAKMMALRAASPIRSKTRYSAPVDGLGLFDAVRSPMML